MGLHVFLHISNLLVPLANTKSSWKVPLFSLWLRFVPSFCLSDVALFPSVHISLILFCSPPNLSGLAFFPSYCPSDFALFLFSLL